MVLNRDLSAAHLSNIIEPGLPSPKHLRSQTTRHPGLHITTTSIDSPTNTRSRIRNTLSDFGLGRTDNTTADTFGYRNSEHPRAKSPSAISRQNIYNYTGGAVAKIKQHLRVGKAERRYDRRKGGWKGKTTKISTKNRPTSFCYRT